MFCSPVQFPLKPRGRRCSPSMSYQHRWDPSPNIGIYPHYPLLLQPSGDSMYRLPCNDRDMHFLEKLKQFRVNHPEFVSAVSSLLGKEKTMSSSAKDKRPASWMSSSAKDKRPSSWTNVTAKEKPVEDIENNLSKASTGAREPVTHQPVTWQRRVSCAGFARDKVLVLVKVVHRAVLVRGVLKEPSPMDDRYKQIFEQRIALPEYVNADAVSCRFISKSDLLLEAPMVSGDDEISCTEQLSRGNISPFNKMGDLPSNATVLSKNSKRLYETENKRDCGEENRRMNMQHNHIDFGNAPSFTEQDETYVFNKDDENAPQTENGKDGADFFKEPESSTSRNHPMPPNSDCPCVRDTRAVESDENMLEYQTEKNVSNKATDNTLEPQDENTDDNANEVNDVVEKNADDVEEREAQPVPDSLFNISQEYELTLEIPDCRPETLVVTMDDSRLLLNIKANKEGPCGAAYTGLVHKTISVPETVDTRKTKCLFQDGILRITAPYKC